MLLTEYVSFKLTSNYFKNLKNLNYPNIENLKKGDLITLSVHDLLPSSTYKIEAVCDICGEKYEISWYNYLRNTNKKTTYFSCSRKCSIQKTINTNIGKFETNWYAQTVEYLKQCKQTNLDIYGVKSPMFLDYIKKKQGDSFEKIYGVRNISQNQNTKNKVKKTKIKKGIQIKDEYLSEWEIYLKNVRNLTNQIRNKLFNDWNGYDYYDNEFIKPYMSLVYTDDKYPTIDHKISVFEGFNNNIIPSIITHYDNLCITKRINNCKKIQNLKKILY